MIRLLLLTLSLALLVPGSTDRPPRAQSDFAAMGTAKILCSAVFVSGRALDEALQNSAGNFLSQADHRLLVAEKHRVVVHREKSEVHVSLHDFTGRARYFGDQGCVILPPGFHDVFFRPVKLTTSLPESLTQDWPMGDRLPPAAPPAGLDEAKLRQAVDAAFDRRSLTAAFLVLHKGRILAEKYDLGAHKDMQLESWSMGKSLTATLVGLLVRQGHLGLHEPAPVAEWRKNPEDPRSRIRISDLLRMSGGLLFSHASQPEWEWGRAMADHLYIYAGAIDAFRFSLSRPPEFPPNTVGRYRNCDPLTLGFLIRETVEKLGENYLAWPQKALFDRIGIRRQVLEPDPYGNFLLTGYDYGTARNWARLGLLYLRDGVWNGERILPEDWARFVSTPAPGWKEPVYGGLFWVNGTRRWKSLPATAYYMSGAGGQHVIIAPDRDLVVVRLGHMRGGSFAEEALNRALDKLWEALPAGV